MNAFRDALAIAKNIVVLSGAGISAESGVPTFRGAGGLWRTYAAQQLATPEAFEANPSLVWEFYHYRRELMRVKDPNPGHKAIAELEARLKSQGRKVTIVTQNIDRLHHRAGSKSIIELHGSLFATRCTKCGVVEENTTSPIVPALQDKGAPDPSSMEAKIPLEELPRCSSGACGGLLRPHVVWFGERLDEEVMRAASEALMECDICLLVGTSSVVYPAAGFAPVVAARGVPVAEFNLEQTPVTSLLRFHFEGKSGDLLPIALARHQSEP
eukprot:Em0018g215a